MIVRSIRRLFLRLLILVVVGGGLLFVTVHANAATLKQQAVVEGEKIRLGDLFDGLESDRAQHEVAPSPAPGRRAVFDYRTLGRIARAYRVEWQPATTLDRVVIERAAHLIDTQVIEQRLIQEITGSKSGKDEMTVELDNKATSIALPLDTEPTLAISRMAHDPISGRFTATIRAPATGTSVYETTITGRSVPIVSVPVLANPLRNGDVISERDLITVKLPAERVGSDILVSTADLVGMTPRRTVAANTPVSANDILEPTVIERGAPVTIQLKQANMNLTAKGRAMDNAARGELLRVMNTASNRVVDAIAIGPNVVEISLP